MIIRIDLLVGGRSTEHDASLHSYKNVVSCLQAAPAQGIILGNVWFLPGDGTARLHSVSCGKPAPTDEAELPLGYTLSLNEMIRMLGASGAYVFSLLHGNEGEDGCFQGVAEVFDIPGNFGSVHASAVSMHKHTQMLVAQALASDILSPIQTEVVRLPFTSSRLTQVLRRFRDTQLIVKPNRLGASLLTTLISAPTVETLTEAFTGISRYDDQALAQERIVGREFTCGILQSPKRLIALPVIEAITNEQFLGHPEKHKKDGVKAVVHLKPNAADFQLIKLIKECSLKLFVEMDFNDMCRFDFLVDQDGRLFFLEANTLPGLMTHSAYPTMLAAAGYTICDLLTFSFQNYRSRPKKKKVYRYNIED